MNALNPGVVANGKLANGITGLVMTPFALKSHRLGPEPPFCPTAILTIPDPTVGLA